MPFLTNSSPQTHYPNNTILLQATSQIDHKIIEDYLNNMYIYICVDIIENRTMELQCHPSQNHLPIHCIKTITTHKHHTQSQHTQTSHIQKTHKHKQHVASNDTNLISGKQHKANVSICLSIHLRTTHKHFFYFMKNSLYFNKICLPPAG